MTSQLVSIICICFNHENFVREAINSVLKQTYKNIELIVVNNGSLDNSEKYILETIENHPNIKYLKIEKVISNTKAFNLAFKETSGSYLIDLSADDSLLEDCVEKQIDFFLKQSQNVGLIFGNAYHINEKGIRIKPFFEVNQNQKVIDKALFNTDYIRIVGSGLVMCSVSSMYTRKHLELLNGYNEELYFEDLDYWLRLLRKFEIKFLDDFLVEKRFLENSLGNQFHKKDTFSKKINWSLREIYNESLKRNRNKLEHKALLKRIHYSMEYSFKNQNWIELLKFSYLELKCRFYILFT